MRNIFDIGLISVVIYALLVLLGVSVERWLVTNGFVRDKTILVIIIAVFAILMKQLSSYFVSWFLFIPLTILAMILGANRDDLWTTMNRGKWWWKKDHTR